MILAPDSFENQALKKLWNNELFRQLVGTHRRTLTILYCQDLRRNLCEDAYVQTITGVGENLYIYDMFRRLYVEYWGSPVTIQIIDFSFLDPSHIALVDQGDILYVCGGATYPELEAVILQGRHSPLVESVRQRVQHGKLLYWGICMGGVIAGSRHLDLMLRLDLQIVYDSNTSYACQHKQS